ncbi:MAG: hypothetical protein QXK49_02980 [Candidatus Aenigmatarchaeota archaeon]
MKAAFTIIQTMFILTLLIILSSISMPWVFENIAISMDLAELKSIKSQFDECNERIIETARTGSTNKCIFNIRRGEISGREEGIYYRLISNAPICDESPLVEIDPKNHIWQECVASGKQRVYGLLWKFPATLNITGEGIQGNQMAGQTTVSNINFEETINFETLTLYVNFQYQPGQSGNIIELSRIEITQTNVTLKINFY